MPDLLAVLLVLFLAILIIVNGPPVRD